jgi:hypothetical protein
LPWLDKFRLWFSALRQCLLMWLCIKIHPVLFELSKMSFYPCIWVVEGAMISG